MRQPKRKIILFTGIFLGLLLGLSLKFTEYYIADLLIEVLEDETRLSCPCEFEVDDLKVSLLTLSASARGARIKDPEKTALEFKKLKLTFDIKDIFQKKVYLNRLDLTDGFSVGVDGRSRTYQFIRQLTKPPSPEKLKNPNRWRVKLLELRIRNLSATEVIAGQDFRLEGGALDMIRSSDDRFILRPTIQKIIFNDQINFGSTSGKINILDQEVEFNEIKTKRGKSHFNLEGKLSKASDIFKFQSDYQFNSKDLKTKDWTGKLTGEAEATGTVNDALIAGNLKLSQNSTLKLNFPRIENFKFNKFSSDYSFQHIEPNSEFRIKNFELSDDNLSIKTIDELVFDQDGLHGNVNLQIKEFLYNNLELQNITAKIKLEGKTKNPNFTASGQLQNLLINDFSFPNTTWEVKREGTDLDLQFKNYNSINQGTMEISSRVSFSPEKDYVFIENLNYNFKNYSFENKKFNRLQNFYLSGEGKLTGPPKLDQLVGGGTLNLSTKFFAGESALNGEVKLDSGLIDISLKNPSESIKANLKYDLQQNSKSQLSIKLDDFQTSDYHPELDCFKTSLEANYQFNPEQITNGNGQILINKFDIGCNQYALKLAKANQIAIGNQNISKINLDLLGNNSEVNIMGQIDLDGMIDLNLQGNLELRALTILTPWLSDLRGTLLGSLDIQGEIFKPSFDGEIELQKTEFTFANEDLTGKDFLGKIKLKKDLVEIQSITGILNNATVDLAGEITPFDLSRSQLSLDYKNFKYEPSSEFYLESSGELALTLDESMTPVLTGEVKVNEAILKKEIGIGTALKYIREYLFTKRQSNAVTRNLSELLLNLKISASRNLFFISSLLETEMKGSLDIQGTLNKPLIRGRLDTLYGWFGLRNSRFDLIEGQVALNPNTSEPTLNVLADTNVINRIGEPVYISMEAQGPISSLLVNFDSDANLTQQEILTLLTTRGLYRSRSQSSTSIRERINDYQERKDKGLFDNIFSALTDLDSIAIEPAFNNRSGLIEPSLTRTRQLSSQLNLSSETFIGGSSNDTRFVVNYDLTPSIRVTGLADTATAQKNTALEFNTSFTLLSKNRKYLATIFKGALGLSKNQILNHLRLNSSSRITNNDLPELTERLFKYYKSQGFYDAEITLACLSELKYCQELEFIINAKKPAKIINLEVAGDAIPDQVFEKFTKFIGEIATQKNKKTFTEELLLRLRSEGYLQARINTNYILNKEHPQAILHTELELGKPLSFIFNGNKLFTAEELLQKTDLLNNKTFFGNNSINILIKDIEKIYREQGYLFAVINSQQYLDPNGRNIIEISIIEEKPLKSLVSKFVNIEQDLISLIKKNAKEYNQDFANNLLHPKSIINEEIENNIFIMKNILSEAGYRNAKITNQVKAVNDLEYEIIYSFEIPEKEKVFTVNITGFPNELDFRNRSEELSNEQINSLEESIKSNLARNAYLNPQISKELLPESNEYQIKIIPGNPIVIDDVDCEPDQTISCAEILKIINLKKNKIASSRTLNLIKSNLLKSGLFEEVQLELLPLANETNKQKLKVRVIEKNLTSLDLGLGVNSELGFHIFSEAVDRSIFKDGRSISLRLDQYIDQTTSEVNQGVAGLRYQDPYFFDQELKYSSDLGYQKFNNPTLEFELDRIILDQSLQKGWSSLSTTFGYSFLNEQLDNVTPGAIISELDQGTLNLSYIYGNLNLDLRNNPENPDLGWFFGLDYKLASKSIESDASFYALLSRASWTTPLFNTPFILANNFALGSAWTYDDTPEIPISQRYYLGGRNSIRGFRENSLGPRGADGAVIGGDLSLSNNFELRYNLNQFLQLHSFYDFGNVFLDDQSISFNELRKSVGVGFRYKSPIGPIGLDFGHPLDRQSGEAAWRVHFSVGSAF